MFLYIAKFVYNVLKNTNIKYIFFKLNFRYNLYIFYKNNINFFSKSKLVNKLVTNLKI